MEDGAQPLAHVSIVVLSYGEDPRAGRLIDSLLAEGTIAASQILEVHNPAADEVNMPESKSHRFLRLAQNAGYAGGMNAAFGDEIVMSRAFVLLLTHDTQVSVAAVARLVRALGEHPELACVGPVLRSGNKLMSAGKPRGRLWGYRHALTIPEGDTVVSTDGLDGSILLLRASAVSGLRMDAGFFMYSEEIDFLERLRRDRRGGIAVVTDTEAESVAGGETSRPRAHAYLTARNGLEVALRHGGLLGCTLHMLHLTRQSWYDLPKPGGERWPDPQLRRIARARLFARARGVLDFIRRRFGPPPPWLQDGDLSI